MSHPFSPAYIQMAKAAEEIQAMRAEFAKGYTLPLDILEDDRNKWWLPRLDQLLGMVERGPYYSAFLHGLADDLSDGQDWHEVVLTQIMFSKYGKTWNGERWVKG